MLLFSFGRVLSRNGVRSLIVELVSTGTELLLGQIMNTNAPYLAKKLNELGFDVLFQSTVGDNQGRMSEVLKVALERADIIITSGGLGPTQGDITKEVTAKILNLELALHQPSVSRIHGYFDHRHMTMPDSNLRQAMIPVGATVVNNERGTAPGVIIECEGKTVIHLPGPPYELAGMFEQSISPYLKKRFGLQGAIISKVLRTCGIGESALEEKIKEHIITQTNPTIALLVRNGEINVRLTAKGSTEEEAFTLIDRLENDLRQQIEPYIFGVDDETLEQALGNILSEKGLNIALAESCTGGLVTSRITDVSGSSKYLIGSVVCYHNDIKLNAVGVPAQVLEANGAVSRETANSMAHNIRTKFGTSIGVGITGIAGPEGGTANKPVGLVFIAIEGPSGGECYQYNYTGSRTAIKQRIAQTAIYHIRQYALSLFKEELI